MGRLRGVVDELDLADLPHLAAFSTRLLQHTPTHTPTQASLQGGQTGLQQIPRWKCQEHVGVKLLSEVENCDLCRVVVWFVFDVFLRSARLP